MQQGTNGYTGGQVCTIIEGSQNQEDTGWINVRSDVAGYLGILYFDLSLVPSGATIISALLTLKFIDVFNSNGEIIVGRLDNPDLSAPWTDLGFEGNSFSQKATYRYKKEETPIKWSTVGAGQNVSDVFHASEDSYIPPFGFNLTHSFNVKSSISAFIAGTVNNAGFYIKTGSANPNARMVGNYAATISDRPKLTIIYTLVPSSSSSSSSSRSSSSSSRSSSSCSSSSSCRSSSSSSSSRGSSSSSSSSCRSSSSSSSCRSSSSSSSSISLTSVALTITTGDLGALPTDDNGLLYTFSSTDYTAVATDDGIYQAVDGLSEYVIIMFKNLIPPGQSFTVTWNGKTDVAPTTSTVFLQILNRTTNTWETLASNNGAAANVDFTLTATKNTNLGDYPDVNNKITCRVYQELIYD